MNHSKHTLRDVVLINTDGFRVDFDADDECAPAIGGLADLPCAFAWKKAAPFRTSKSRKLMLPSPWRSSSASMPKNRVAAVTN